MNSGSSSVGVGVGPSGATAPLGFGPLGVGSMAGYSPAPGATANGAGMNEGVHHAAHAPSSHHSAAAAAAAAHHHTQMGGYDLVQSAAQHGFPGSFAQPGHFSSQNYYHQGGWPLEMYSTLCPNPTPSSFSHCRLLQADHLNNSRSVPLLRFDPRPMGL